MCWLLEQCVWMIAGLCLLALERMPGLDCGALQLQEGLWSSKLGCSRLAVVDSWPFQCPATGLRQ
jgi:hypothetical protein